MTLDNKFEIGDKVFIKRNIKFHVNLRKPFTISLVEARFVLKGKPPIIHYCVKELKGVPFNEHELIAADDKAKETMRQALNDEISKLELQIETARKQLGELK